MDNLQTPHTLIQVKAGEAKTIQLNTETSVHVEVESAGQLRLVEAFAGPICHMRIHLHQGAKLEHIRMLKPSHQQVTIEDQVTQEANSVYQHFFVYNSRGHTKVKTKVWLQGEEAVCNLRGILLGSSNDKAHLAFAVEHAAGNCKSGQQVKTILGGQASSLFEGLIRVQKGADGTDASQSNPNLVLSADAVAQTRPQLEIDADDVKCSHGATVGQLDENAIFYMRSKGVAEPNAKAMMTFGFAAELLEQIPSRELLPEIYQGLALFVRETLGITEG